jgi:hypothetical protein
MRGTGTDAAHKAAHFLGMSTADFPQNSIAP